MGDVTFANLPIGFVKLYILGISVNKFDNLKLGIFKLGVFKIRHF